MKAVVLNRGAGVRTQFMRERKGANFSVRSIQHRDFTKDATEAEL